MSGKMSGCGHGPNQFYDQDGAFCPRCRRNVGPVYAPQEIVGMSYSLHDARVGCRGGSSAFDPPCVPADHADTARRLSATGYLVVPRHLVGLGR